MGADAIASGPSLRDVFETITERNSVNSVRSSDPERSRRGTGVILINGAGVLMRNGADVAIRKTVLMLVHTGSPADLLICS